MTKNVARRGAGARGGRPRLLTSAVVAGLLSACCTLSSAGTFKCTEDGKTVYSDRPCPAGGNELAIPAKPVPARKSSQEAAMGTCFFMYSSALSRDYSRAEETGRSAPAPSRVYGMSATIFARIPNRFGAMEQVMMECPLNPDLSLNGDALAKILVQLPRR